MRKRTLAWLSRFSQRPGSIFLRRSRPLSNSSFLCTHSSKAIDLTFVFSKALDDGALAGRVVAGPLLPEGRQTGRPLDDCIVGYFDDSYY